MSVEELVWRQPGSDEPPCTICSEELLSPPDPQFSQLCAVPVCKHKFHFKCLEGWWRPGNRTCPNCRQGFTQVLAEGQGKIEIGDASVGEEEEEEESEDEDDQEACVVCRGYGEVMICDGCDRNFHVHCAGLDSVPEDRWYCSVCRPRFSSRSGPTTGANATRNVRTVFTERGYDEMSRGRDDQSRHPADNPAEERPSQEELVQAEGLWDYFDLFNKGAQQQGSTPVSRKGTQEKSSPSSLSVSAVLQIIKSTINDDQRRHRAMSQVVHALNQNRSSNFSADLLARGLLVHLRGWFQVSLDHPQKNSLAERYFRSVLLSEVDALKDLIKRNELVQSRFTKILMRCIAEDSSRTTKDTATRLMGFFCPIISSDASRQSSHGSASSTVSGQTVPSSSSSAVAAAPIKRAKIRQRN